MPNDADLILYRDLAVALNAPPNGHMVRQLRPAGDHLAFISDSGPGDWRRVDAMARARWPDLPPRGRIASDGTELESVPERVVFEMLSRLLQPGMVIDLHQPILSEDPRYRADFTLRFGTAKTFIEVVGACGSDRVTRNEQEAQWLARFDARMRFYRDQGLTPTCFYLNDLAWPWSLRRQCRDLVLAIASKGVVR